MERITNYSLEQSLTIICSEWTGVLTSENFHRTMIINTGYMIRYLPILTSVDLIHVIWNKIIPVYEQL